MKIAVTGASGFVGNRVVEKFYLGHDLDVVPIVHSNASLVRPARFDLPWSVSDHTSVEAMAKAFDGCDFAIHAAFGSPLNRISKTVYQAADRAKVKRLIVLSTASIYNQNPLPGTTEESPLPDEPATSYNAAKIASDAVIRKQRAKGSTELVFLMPMIVFGPRSHWVARVVSQALDRTLYLINRGEGVCNSVYIDNLVEAIRLALTAPGIDGESFFVSDTERVTWADFYRPIVTAAGISFDEVNFIDAPELPGVSKREQILEQLATLSETVEVQRIKPHVPKSFKKLYKGARSVLAPKTVPSSDFEPWDGPVPDPAADMVMLQQSTYKFPNTKAERLLNYKPVVSFDEGMRRSIGWLQFAGYSVGAEKDAGSRASAAINV